MVFSHKMGMAKQILKPLALGLNSTGLLPWVIDALEGVSTKNLQSLAMKIFETERSSAPEAETHDKKMDVRLVFSAAGVEVVVGKSLENPADIISSAIVVLAVEERQQVLQRILEINRTRKGETAEK